MNQEDITLKKLRDEKMRQLVRKNDVGLRELTRQLDLAKVYKVRFCQIAEKEAKKNEDKLANIAALEEMKNNLETQACEAQKERDMKHKRENEYSQGLKDQFFEKKVRSEMMEKESQEERMRIDAMINDIQEEKIR